MRQSENNKLEALESRFKFLSETITLDYQPQDWSEVEALLENEKKSDDKLIIPFLPIGIAISLFIALITLFQINQGTRNISSNTIAKDLKETPKSTSSEDQIYTTTENQERDEKHNNNVKESESINQKIKTEREAKQTYLDHTIINKSKDKQIKRPNPTGSQLGMDQSTRDSDILSLSIPHNERPIDKTARASKGTPVENLNGSSNLEKNQNEKEKVTTPSVTLQKPIASAELGDRNLTQQIPDLLKISPTEIVSTEKNEIVTIPEDQLIEIAQAKTPKLFLNANAGVELAQTPRGNLGDTDYNFGLKIGYVTNSKIAFTVGVNYISECYSALGEDYSPPAGFWSSTNGVAPDEY